MGLDFKEPCKFTMSANEIRVFSECPRKRYYSSRDCLAVRANKPSNNLILGSAFHATLEYYYTEIDKKIKEMGLTNPTLEQCQEAMSQVHEYDLNSSENHELSEGDLSTYNCIISLYKEQLIKDLVDYEVVGCEQAFYLYNWPCDDVMYHGLVDMIVRSRHDGKIYFFEHKTCAGFRPEIYSRFDIQLHIYATYGKLTYGEEFGGMLLNQVKKAKTSRGYDQLRTLYTYDDAEINDFFIWLKAKTEAAISPSNLHAPCNNYMSCKTCEFQNICMKFGYHVPQDKDEVITQFKDEEGNPEFLYDPRVTEEEEA